MGYISKEQNVPKVQDTTTSYKSLCKKNIMHVKNDNHSYDIFISKISVKRIHITGKTISFLKNLSFYLIGLFTPIFLYIKPANFKQLLNTITALFINLWQFLIFLSPYSRNIPNDKFLFPLNVGTCITLILLIITMLEDKIVRRIKIIRIMHLILAVIMWYLNYAISYLLINIEILYRTLCVIILIGFNFVIYIILILCIDKINYYIKKRKLKN